VLNATRSMGTELAVATIGPTSAPTPLPLPTALPEPTSGPVLGAAPTQAPVDTGATPAPTAVAGVAGGPAGLGATAAPTGEPEAPIVLEVRTEPGDNPGSWLEIKTDGTSVFRKVLGAGQYLRYTAQRDVWLRAGNAAVVSLTINGQPQPPLSNVPGDVVTFSWPP
jgi:hypothetical protein